MRALSGAASLTLLVAIAGRVLPGRSVAGHAVVQGGQPGVRVSGLGQGVGPVRRGGERGPGAVARPTSTWRTAYDNQFRPSRKGEAANDALLEKAIENYKTASEKLAASESEDDKKLGKLSLEYLVAAYGPDKLNDPAQAEPVVQRMIQLEPNEPSNYFALAKIYEDAGAYAEAEQMLLRAKDVRPNDSAVYMQLAGYYNRQNMFDKTIDALEQRAAKEPNNPEAFFTISTYYWDNAQRNFRLTDAEKRDNVEQGPRGGRQGDRDQGGLHGGAGLQGPAPARPGAAREGSGQAAGAHQGSHRPCAIRPRNSARSARPSSCKVVLPTALSARFRVALSS